MDVFKFDCSSLVDLSLLIPTTNPDQITQLWLQDIYHNKYSNNVSDLYFSVGHNKEV